MAGWLDLIFNGGLGGNLGPARTPGINPNARTAGQSQANTGGFKWSDLYPWLIGAGATVAGGALTARSQNQQNERLDERAKLNDQLARDEMARREAYASMVLPSLLQALGIRDPNMAQMAKMRQQAIPGYGGQFGQPTQGLNPRALAMSGYDPVNGSYRIRKPGDDYGENVQQFSQGAYGARTY